MIRHTFSPLEAMLFDMDGTLTSSRAASERCWRRWAEKHHMDAEKVLALCHGRQARETIDMAAPHLDATAEAAWLLAEELADPDGVVAIAGAAEFVKQLPTHRWALVTSAAKALAQYRLKLAGISLPTVMVCAEDAPVGKPDPAGYLLAAKKLDVKPAHCLVFEDTAVGIAAGKHAGMHTLGIDASGAGAPKGAEQVVHDYIALRYVAGPPMQVSVL